MQQVWVCARRRSILLVMGAMLLAAGCGGGGGGGGDSDGGSGTTKVLKTLSQYTPPDGSFWQTACRPVASPSTIGADRDTLTFNSSGASITVLTESWNANICSGTADNIHGGPQTLGITVDGTATVSWYAYTPAWGTVPTYTSLGMPAAPTASEVTVGTDKFTVLFDITDSVNPVVYTSTSEGSMNGGLYFNQLSTFGASKQ